MDDLTGDPGGVLAGEEGDGAGGVVGGAEAAEGELGRRAARRSSSIQPVSVGPGLTALTVMPRWAMPSARERVKASTAPLVEA